MNKYQVCDVVVHMLLRRNVNYMRMYMYMSMSVVTCSFAIHPHFNNMFMTRSLGNWFPLVKEFSTSGEIPKKGGMGVWEFRIWWERSGVEELGPQFQTGGIMIPHPQNYLKFPSVSNSSQVGNPCSSQWNSYISLKQPVLFYVANSISYL